MLSENIRRQLTSEQNWEENMESVIKIQSKNHLYTLELVNVCRKDEVTNGFIVYGGKLGEAPDASYFAEDVSKKIEGIKLLHIDAFGKLPNGLLYLGVKVLEHAKLLREEGELALVSIGEEKRKIETQLLIPNAKVVKGSKLLRIWK